MGDGPFRDGSAAFERAETLARENAELLSEIERLRNASSEAERARAYDDTLRRLTRERDALKIELDKMRYSAPAVLDSATRKLREERDELREQLARLGPPEPEVDTLRQRLDAAQSALVEADRDIKRIADQRDALAREVAALRERVPPSDDNRSAVLQRVIEERDELLARVRDLEEQLASATRRRR